MLLDIQHHGQTLEQTLFSTKCSNRSNAINCLPKKRVNRASIGRVQTLQFPVCDLRRLEEKQKAWVSVCRHTDVSAVGKPATYGKVCLLNTIVNDDWDKADSENRGNDRNDNNRTDNIKQGL